MGIERQIACKAIALTTIAPQPRHRNKNHSTINNFQNKITYNCYCIIKKRNKQALSDAFIVFGDISYAS